MVDIYYYIPISRAEDVVGCGLKLSEWFDKEVPLNGETRKCISALLNPRDDMKKYKSNNFKCLKIEVEPERCYVADRFLYEAAKLSDEARNLYIKTIMPVSKYIFGTYRLPECLIFGTVLSEQIDLADMVLGSPVLYENSEKLYTSNILEAYREKDEDFNDVLLYYFYNKLAEFQKVDKIEDKDKRLAVFFDKNKDKTFCIRVHYEKNEST